jgi:hypothetical protein
MKNTPRISDDLAEQIAKVTNKRARFVLDAIAQNGIVTTEEISRAGYEHPPRAARDARELGFPIQTVKAKHSNGRSIAAYAFLENARFGRGKSGRKMLPKKQRDELVAAAGSRCQICGAAENLQVDHRIPYEIAGEAASYEPVLFMVLCGSCNRTKSWSCEHCPNWTAPHDPAICQTCYWSGHPEYLHIATEQQRRVDIVWAQSEIDGYEKLRMRAEAARQAVPEYIKRVLKKS